MSRRPRALSDVSRPSWSSGGDMADLYEAPDTGAATATTTATTTASTTRTDKHLPLLRLFQQQPHHASSEPSTQTANTPATPSSSGVPDSPRVRGHDRRRSDGLMLNGKLDLPSSSPPLVPLVTATAAGAGGGQKQSPRTSVTAEQMAAVTGLNPKYLHVRENSTVHTSPSLNMSSSSSAEPIGRGSFGSDKDSIDSTDNAKGKPPRRKHSVRMRTIALAVRCLMALLPKTYKEAQVIYENSPDGEGKPRVRAATIDGIVATLTPLDSVDQEYLQDMLATLRYFTTPRELIDKLVVRFHWRPESDPNTDIVQLRVINLLKRWLKEHVDDSDVDSTSAITRLTTFIQNDVAKAPDEAIARWAEQLTRMAYEWQSLGTALKRSNSVRGSPVKTSPNFGNNLVDFTNTNPVDIFRQLTLMEAEMFKAITPRDLFYKTADKHHESVIIRDLIDHFNKISFWVAKEICFCASLKQRVIILKRFVYIAFMCLEWKNFNTCLEIVGGLMMSSVQRLKKTWKNLPSKYVTMWTQLQAVTSPRQNYLAYRNYVKKLEPPILPYVGVYLSDLTVIQEKYPTRMAGGLINVNKLRMVANVITAFQNYQASCSFPFMDNIIMRQYLEVDARIVTEEILYSASRVAEPPVEAPDSSSSSSASSNSNSTSSPRKPFTIETVGRSWRGTITPTAIKFGVNSSSSSAESSFITPR